MHFSMFRDFPDAMTIEATGYDIVLQRRSAGSLIMPHGGLVACDPLSQLDAEPFAQVLGPGRFAASVLVAELRDEQRIAYAQLRLGENPVVRWERADELPQTSPFAHYPHVRPVTREEGGFAVESGVACFMDVATANDLLDYHQAVLPEDNEFEKHLHIRMRRRKHGVSFGSLGLRQDLKIPVSDERNVVYFDPGYGKGLYSTYFGRDAAGGIATVVTDFRVLDLHFPSFALPATGSGR